MDFQELVSVCNFGGSLLVHDNACKVMHGTCLCIHVVWVLVHQSTFISDLKKNGVTGSLVVLGYG